MSLQVFVLFANCIPVKGARRSLLCDLQNGRLKLIPNSMYDMLIEHKNKPPEDIKQAYDHAYDEEIDEYFSFLIDEGWGFWCDDPAAFPDLSLDFHCPDTITNAIIDADATSDHDYSDLFAQLQDLGCKHVELRFFDPLSPSRLATILSSTTDSRIRGIEVLLPYSESFDEADAIALCQRHPRIVRMTFTGAPALRHLNTSANSKQMGLVIYHPDVVDSQLHCGVVDKMYFAVNVVAFTEARHHNSCLNRKISVDARGFIRNCPSMTSDYGKASRKRLAAAIDEAGFREPWSVTKDQVTICKDCEFRYVCSDCRAYLQGEGGGYAKPAGCDYDPYTATWGPKPLEPYAV